jgi:hypothetical protein
MTNAGYFGFMGSVLISSSSSYCGSSWSRQIAPPGERCRNESREPVYVHNPHWEPVYVHNPHWEPVYVHNPLCFLHTASPHSNIINLVFCERTNSNYKLWIFRVVDSSTLVSREVDSLPQRVPRHAVSFTCMNCPISHIWYVRYYMHDMSDITCMICPIEHVWYVKNHGNSAICTFSNTCIFQWIATACYDTVLSALYVPS